MQFYPIYHTIAKPSQNKKSVTNSKKMKHLKTLIPL